MFTYINVGLLFMKFIITTRFTVLLNREDYESNNGFSFQISEMIFLSSCKGHVTSLNVWFCVITVY